MPHRLSPTPGRLLPTTAVCAVLAAAGLLACSDRSPTATELDPQFAAGGGPPIRVTGTDPTGGEQGVTLDVRVLGSNFEPGSGATFTLDGVPPGKVTTNSTTYVSSDELIANITIDAGADLGLYDVEVITPRGKKGVGTELFAVRVAGGGPPEFPSTSLSISFRDAVGDGVSSDGNGAYQDNSDGVRAFVYLGSDQDFEGQIHLNTDWDDQDPEFRTLKLYLRAPDGSQTFVDADATVRFAINGAELSAFNALGVGESLSYRMHFQFEDADARYDLRFGSECGGQGERPNERVLVTLVQESPKAWQFAHSGDGLLCVVPAKGKGKPLSSYSVVVAAPFGLLAVEAN